MKWQIYFDDGTTWNYKQGIPPHKRKVGTIAIIQERADGFYRVMDHGDFYWYDGEGWLVVDTYGMLDALIYNLDKIKCAIAGRMVTDFRFRDIYKQAKKDADNGTLG